MQARGSVCAGGYQSIILAGDVGVREKLTGRPWWAARCVLGVAGGD